MDRELTNNILKYNLGVFNIWHNKLFDYCYERLDEYSLNKIIMYDVNPKYHKIYNENKHYNIIQEYKLDKYNSDLQKYNYCQTSCLYHVFINNIYINLDYIGFIQYDMELDQNFIYDIQNKIIEKRATNTIFFYSLLVSNKVDTLHLCNPYENSILEQYNKFFNTTHTYKSIKNNNKSSNFICLHTFVIPIDIYVKMMTWYCSIHEWLHNKYMNCFYTKSISEITEEIFGLFLLLQLLENENIIIEELHLKHNWPHLHDQTEWDNYKKTIQCMK